MMSGTEHLTPSEEELKAMLKTLDDEIRPRVIQDWYLYIAVTLIDHLLRVILDLHEGACHIFGFGDPQENACYLCRYTLDCSKERP